MTVRRLTWSDFESCLDHICARVNGVRGVLGVPRGGLPLAVALSHRLDLPLLAAPVPACLVVDDVRESGLTLGRYLCVDSCLVWVWVDKLPGGDVVQSVIRADPAEWIVFPWEDSGKAVDDRARYYAARQ